MRKAVFLDRDGTLMNDTGYPSDPDEVRLVPEILPALRKFQASGYLLVIVSNQSGIGRGFLTEAQYQAVQQRVLDLLAREGIQIEASYYCPHAPAADCFCRKPRPGLLLLAAHDHALDLSQSIMIGDKPSDIEAGRAAGCRQSIHPRDLVAT